MHFLQEQFLFLTAILLILFVPGLSFLYAFFKNTFTSLEKYALALPVSIAIVNVLIIIIGTLGIAITATSIVGFIALVSLFFCLLGSIAKTHTSKVPEKIYAFSKQEGTLIILIFALTLFIKTVYLSDVILPTATDLGHHMYWAKDIATTGELPHYVERNIIQSKIDGSYALGNPEPIDDFIIGEHLIFAAIGLISGIDFISGFPAIILLLVNMFSLLVIFIFVLRAFSVKLFAYNNISAKHIALLALFMLGPLYTLASPQAKFVSGGVIGNTLGNLFIPTLLYMYWRALQEKSPRLLTLAFFLTFGLAYIHHLSTLVFLFILIFTIIIFALLHTKTIHIYLLAWIKMCLKPAPLLCIMSAILFFFFVLAPSYADPKSIDTALGAPTKTTRTGLTFSQFTFSTGEGRLGLGLASIIVLFLLHIQSARTRKNTDYTSAFFLAWGVSIFIMSLRPQWLMLDIPSNRIASYAVFPFALLSSITLIYVFHRHARVSKERGTRGSSAIFFPAYVVILTFCIAGGFYDNSQSILTKTKAQEAIETYHVSDYLAQHTQENDLILKDHNYIVADSWMKLAFLQGYTYPLSRGYFKRYEDETKPREQCTLWMIAIPNTDKGRKCFDETGTSIIVVNPHFDSVQFKKSDAFSSIYQSNDIAVYMRK